MDPKSVANSNVQNLKFFKQIRVYSCEFVVSLKKRTKFNVFNIENADAAKSILFILVIQV